MFYLSAEVKVSILVAINIPYTLLTLFILVYMWCSKAWKSKLIGAQSSYKDIDLIHYPVT